MKVFHLVHQYLPEFVGGTELYTQALVQAMSQRNWQSAIFYRSYANQTPLTTEHRTDATVFAAASGPFSPTHRFLATWRNPALHAAWLRALDEFTPDLVHVQHLMGLPVSLIDVLIERRIPYVVTLLDYWWLCANANLLTNHSHAACAGPRAYLNCTHCAVARIGRDSAWAAAPILWGLMIDRSRWLHRLLDRADMLLAPSDFVRDWYSAHGAPARNLRTVRWGVFPPSAAARRNRVDDGALHLLYVGGLAPNKGIHVVLEALRGVTGAVRMAVAGDETTHPAYVSRLHHLADERVAFLGRLDRHQVWQAMVDADAVMVPSLWHETFCLVAHEALAAGAPVIASEMGALTEAVRNGVDGLLLPPGDVEAWRRAIQRCVDEPHLLPSLRAGVVAPRTFVEHVDQVEALYREILTATR